MDDIEREITLVEENNKMDNTINKFAGQSDLVKY
jgi:hypothetical protein